MRTYDDYEVQQIIKNVAKIFDETKGVHERGICLSAKPSIDDEGEVILELYIRVGFGIFEVEEALWKRIKISELLEEAKK